MALFIARLLVIMGTSGREESTILNWLWQLVIAPSSIVMLSSPYPPGEVLRRLRNQGKIAQVQKSSQIVIHVPVRNNQRRFLARVEADADNRTRLIGRMQTPYRIALFRMVASLFLFGMAILWLQVGRIWLGAIFGIGAVGFLLGSQYERLLHLEWLRRVLDAEIAR